MTTPPNNASRDDEPLDRDDPAEKLLLNLNPQQREAVCHLDGPMLVLAGPGSGKTRVVTHRIAWLLSRGVPARSIVALTFTNKAADEMKARLETLAPGARVWIGTFHRFCAYLLRLYSSCVGLTPNYAIYDVDACKRLLEDVAPKKTLPQGVDHARIASEISWAKNSMTSPDEYVAKSGSLCGKIVEEVYPKYQNALRDANAVDFDDLLVLVAELLQKHPEIRAQLDERFRYVLVDEYQDTNLVQYAIARALSIDYPNLAVTGDPDQSIYGWRGANIKNILNFESDFDDVKVVRLEENYRSVKSVLRVADSVVKHNKNRKPKDLFTNNPEGVPPRLLVALDQNEEADAVAAEIAAEIAAGKRRPRDYAVFYRMNALSRNLEYALRRCGVPFQLVRGLEFFNRKEIKDLCAYLQLAHNPRDSVAFKRVVNLPARGVGRVSLARLEQYAQSRGLSLFEAAKEAAITPGLSAKVAKSLAKFVAIVESVQEIFEEDGDLEVAVSLIIEKTQYKQHIATSSAEAVEDRLANVEEFLTEAREFDSDFNNTQAEKDALDLEFDREIKRDRLGRFLEQIALVNDVDDWESDDDRVSLMTLHAAKGLEFPVVYIVALEDGVLPHERSRDNKNQLEEERRLLFVGVTRAKEELRISSARYREFRGSFAPTITSRFIFEFPKDGVERFNSVEEWIEARRDAANAAPGDAIVVPKIVGREFGVSQRQAFIESAREKRAAKDAWNYEDVERAAVDAERSAGKRRKRDDFDEYVDQEPEDDYCQLAPDEFGDDARANDEERVFNTEGEEISRDARRKAAAKREPMSVAPYAVFTADQLQGGRDASKSAAKAPKKIVVNSFVSHKRYGVGVVKKISGPSFDRIAVIDFISKVGTLELPLNDPELSLAFIGRGE